MSDEDSNSERLRRRQRMMEAFRASPIESLTDIIVQRHPWIYGWCTILGSIALTFGGIIAGALVLRYAERPTDSSPRHSVYNLREGTALNHEEAYFAAYPEARQRLAMDARRSPQARRGDVDSLASSTSSDFPQLSVSDASTALNLSIERDDYRPDSTELAFRYCDLNRERQRKKVVRRRWSSTPNIRLNPMDQFMSSMGLEVIEAIDEGAVGGITEDFELEDLDDQEDQAVGETESVGSLETPL